MYNFVFSSASLQSLCTLAFLHVSAHPKHKRILRLPNRPVLYLNTIASFRNKLMYHSREVLIIERALAPSHHGSSHDNDFRTRHIESCRRLLICVRHSNSEPCTELHRCQTSVEYCHTSWGI
jgi:hypothetical protein